MTELERMSGIEVERAYRELLKAQRLSKTPEDREAADDDLRHFIRMMAAGRIAEWFANRSTE